MAGITTSGRGSLSTPPPTPNGRTLQGALLDLSNTTSEVFTSTGLTITLPVAGTYMIEQSVRSSITAANVAYIISRLFNVTDAVAVANTELLCSYSPGNSIRLPSTFTATSPVTVTGPTVIRLEASRTNAATNAVVESSGAGRTALTWWRLA